MEIEAEYGKVSQNKSGAEPADDYHICLRKLQYIYIYIYRVFEQSS